MLLACWASCMAAQEIVPLDSCRARALRSNKELKMAELRKEKARWDRKAAFTKYLPHVDVVGAYMFTSREISLLNDRQKSALGSLGSNVAGILGQLQQLEPVLNPILEQAVGSYLQTLPEAFRPAALQIISEKIAGMKSAVAELPSAVQGVGNNLLEAFRTDTRNMGMISAMFTQPVYMGGKIAAYNKITRFSEQLAQSKLELEQQNIIQSVEETYWHIVQLSSKRKLAQSYLELVSKLDQDVDKLISEGFATKADGLSVKVRKNEAQVTLLQVDNGLALLRMLLAQQCGMDDENFVLKDELSDALAMPVADYGDAEAALEARPEMEQLRLADEIYRQKVNIVRSEFMPNVVLTGGYVTTNPSVFNGFENRFGDMFTVGVGVKIPVITWGERTYKVRSAKIEAGIQRLQREEAGEKIRLQIKQCQQKLLEARERMLAAETGKSQADENLRMAEYGLKEGVIPLTNVMAAQTAWLGAHSAFTSSQIDVLLADVYLRKALGVLR